MAIIESKYINIKYIPKFKGYLLTLTNKNINRKLLYTEYKLIREKFSNSILITFENSMIKNHTKYFTRLGNKVIYELTI